MFRRLFGGALALLAMLLTMGCGRPAAPHDAVRVFAAASLRESFLALGAEFRADHPQVALDFVFAGSSTLASQIVHGAEAAVFAAADEASMSRLATAHLVDGAPRTFATNRLGIAVAAGNPKRVAGLADLARPDLAVVLAAPTVPAGAYASRVLDMVGVELRPRSFEADVRSVLTKVSLGEADAGIVYVTDVAAGGANIQGVDIPEGQNVIARYPIAVVKDSGGTSARAFRDFVLSPRGREVLTSFGFGAP